MSLSRRQLLQAASSASLGVVAGGSLQRSRAAAQSGEKEAVTIQFWTHDQNYIDFFTARAAELTESADSAYAYELNITQAPTRSGSRSHNFRASCSAASPSRPCST
jgi:hypothetical protein